MKSSKVIAITNEKGGVGKTTTAKNISYNLSTKMRVLLIDLDPQMNASKGLGIQEPKSDVTSLFEKVMKKRAVKRTRYVNLDIVPGNRNLTLLNNINQEYFFYNIELLKQQYDCIVIDTSPYFNELTALSLLSADQVIIPIDIDIDAMDGMESTMKEVHDLRGSLSNCKILLTKVNHARVQNRNDLKEITESFGSNAFDTVISFDKDAVKNTRIRNSVLTKSYQTRAITKEYEQLSDEIIKEVF